MHKLAACLLLLVAATNAANVKGSLRQKAGVNGFVRALEFKHRLRVCNAYPYAGSLDVFRSKEKLTDDAMPYKACKDFMSPLQAGDKLVFKVGEASAGTFSVSDLPNNDAVLLLVIHRHDTLSTAVSFESHVFANLLNAQVAVIDTYKGRALAAPRIRDAASHSKGSDSRTEDLRYRSVVAVNPGVYDVELDDKEGKSFGKSQLVALNRESYIILRVGVDAQQGPKYAQELVVYPQSDPALLHSGAVSHGVFAALVAAVFALMA